MYFILLTSQLADAVVMAILLRVAFEVYFSLFLPVM